MPCDPENNDKKRREEKEGVPAAPGGGGGAGMSPAPATGAPGGGGAGGAPFASAAGAAAAPSLIPSIEFSFASKRLSVISRRRIVVLILLSFVSAAQANLFKNCVVLRTKLLTNCSVTAEDTGGTSV